PGHRAEQHGLRLRGGCRAPAPGARHQHHSARPDGHVPEGGRAMSETRASITVIDPPRRKLPAKQRWAGRVQSLLLIIMALIALVPIIAIFLGTFQDGGTLLRSGITFAIDFRSFDLDSYRVLFTDSGDYFLWFWNSLWLTRSEEHTS